MLWRPHPRDGELQIVMTANLSPERLRTLVAMAQEHALPAPALRPYPGWRFGIEANRPSPEVELRRDAWRYFADNGITQPIVVPWYRGLSLSLVLGNDTSLGVYVCGSYEPNDFFFFDRCVPEGGTVLDIGANEGLYTVFSAQKVGPSGRVVAIEPSTRELARLKENVRLNGFTNVDIVECAVGAASGSAEIHIAQHEHAGHNTLGTFVYDVREAARETVVLRTVDDIVAELNLSRVDAIKADIEGAELEMLRGCTQTLKRFRPILFLEVMPAALAGQNGSVEELLALLRAENYRVKSLDNATASLTPFAPAEFSPTVIAEPAERAIARSHVPYPGDVLHRALDREPRLRDEVPVFDEPLAQEINKARLEHLTWMDLPLAGRSVLDVGGGPGHLAKYFVDRKCRVLVTDGRPENIARARELYHHDAKVIDVESHEFPALGTFDIVFCYGLLYHVENPLLTLRHLVGAANDLVLLETMVCDSRLPLVQTVDEPLSANQALGGLASRPSPAWIAMVFDRLGMYVYAPKEQPEHRDFIFDWYDDLANGRSGNNLRCIFVASKKPLDNPKLVPLVRR